METTCKKQTLKFLTAGILLIAVASLCIVQSCEKKNEQTEQKFAKALADWVFCDWYSSLNILLELDDVAPDGSRHTFVFTEDQEDTTIDESWSTGGAACSACETYKKISEILQKYGNSGLQIKIVSESDGCKKIYHRTPQL